MCAKSVKGHHRAARRLAWAALSLGLLSSLWWRTEIPVGGATPGPRKHKYVIMLTVSRDSSLEKTMDQEFLAALRRDTRTVGLNITRSGKPWYDTETCKGDPMCDRIAINA
ncbi:MAG TPA: hypothetical protein VJT74_05990, partial [Pyrinomonadaceae bacterium]|nr:hypothetical protein [Pyrinomonadaceae bacterium]